MSYIVNQAFDSYDLLSPLQPTPKKATIFTPFHSKNSTQRRSKLEYGLH